MVSDEVWLLGNAQRFNDDGGAMFSVLQNATATSPTPNFQTLIVFNLNYALLFLVLSGLYMIVTNRKVLFSVKEAMKSTGTDAVVVVDDAENPLGIITMDDIQTKV
ncbi:MAG: hypothetical protein ABSC50_09365 [Candidatus Bathyarchaeia archaeon]